MEKFCALCFIIFLDILVVSCQEPHCNKFSFEEQLLEKMVRLEFKVETIYENMVKAQQDVKNVASKVDKELNLLRKERERIKTDVSVLKADASKRIEDAKNELTATVNDFEEKIARMSEDIYVFANESIAKAKGSSSSSVTYTRWGRTTCPNNSTLLYEGYAAGSLYTNDGGSSDTVCLPKDPQFGKHQSGTQGYSYLYNAEYERGSQTQAVFGKSLQDQDVPCAVCEVGGRSAILMIPARIDCYKGWTKEYSGYLMTSYASHSRSSLKCVDGRPETIPGMSGKNNGDLFYLVEIAGAIPDPPYTRGAELTCVVCTK